MKKIIMGLFAVVMCLSSFKGMAQDAKLKIKITEEDASTIGKLHNFYLEDILKKKISSESAIYDYINNLKLEGDGVDEFKKNFKITTYEENLTFLNKNISNESFFKLLNKALDLLNDEKNTVVKISEEVDGIKKEGKEKLDEREYTILTTALEVFKNSSEFWLPKEQGGNGLGDDYLNLNNGSTGYLNSINLMLEGKVSNVAFVENNNMDNLIYYSNCNIDFSKPQPSGRARKIIAADVMGAATYMATYGWFVPWAGPVSLGVFTASCAVAAAIASGQSAIGL